ncbi:hypothetical protein DQQ10_27530 [Pseudochryseolinea flava]|uniref:Uncharacterized protein n=1 Tax=Pseudochryseolinea flava TaxID=2059302 RepID=A0A364XUI9_9BACT|nr:hypothetical protein DQQ10_27530 [Pseudochryseolinea flava]
MSKIIRDKGEKLSKIEYWKKWEIFELFDDLHEAEQLLNSRKSKGYRHDKFKTEFTEEFGEIEGDNVADFTRIWQWFSPNNEWDKVVGPEGEELRRRIFKRTDRWKRNQEFIPWTKVSLKEEFGIVLDKTVDNNVVGLIRWDTEKETDVEDWRGLFGSFLQSGGQVVDHDHKFKFIDDKGELKKVSR